MSQVVTPTLVPAISGSQDVKDSAREFVLDLLQKTLDSFFCNEHRHY